MRVFAKVSTVISTLLVAGFAASVVSAQNLVITNARIIVGDGQVIEKGAVVVRDGKIAAVTSGAATGAASGSVRINGAGKTVMAGFIDVHRHLIYGPPERYFTEQAADRMRELLEAGLHDRAGGRR
jgi:imidazolonepropionase-like amidohydrolase